MDKKIQDIVRGLVGSQELTVEPDLWREKSAIAALLFMVMPIDGQIHDSELDRLSLILADQFEISDIEVAALIDAARKEAGSTGTLRCMTEHLKTALSVTERITLISHMWEMVFADGLLHEFEVLLVERVGGLLGLDPEMVSESMVTDRGSKG